MVFLLFNEQMLEKVQIYLTKYPSQLEVQLLFSHHVYNVKRDHYLIFSWLHSRLYTRRQSRLLGNQIYLEMPVVNQFMYISYIFLNVIHNIVMILST